MKIYEGVFHCETCDDFDWKYCKLDNGQVMIGLLDEICKNVTILKIYYRADALRLQIKDNEKYKELYYNLLDKGYVLQRDTARPESTHWRFSILCKSS